SMTPSSAPGSVMTPVPAMRPTGVTIIALLALISGLLGLCGVTPLFGISLLGALIPAGVPQALAALGVILGLVWQSVQFCRSSLHTAHGTCAHGRGGWVSSQREFRCSARWRRLLRAAAQ